MKDVNREDVKEEGEGEREGEEGAGASERELRQAETVM